MVLDRSDKQDLLEAPDTAPRLRAELALLKRARVSVRSDPARALALTAEHAARFAAGTFAEEREVIAIEALGQLPGLVAGEWDPPGAEPLPLRLSAGPGAPDLADLRGQAHLRHALEVAAAIAAGGPAAAHTRPHCRHCPPPGQCSQGTPSPAADAASVASQSS